jgi:N-acetylglucosamine kinase-like BadF-type ATPase
MTRYFLGVDVGGTKTHALIADENGRVVGFGRSGPGNWESVGYAGFTRALTEAVGVALNQAELAVTDIAGAGMGIGGFDWPSERQDHLTAILPLGLTCPLEIVNDATLGLLAGTSEGWGVSVVAGTGCNARGWSKDHTREGRAVGGGGDWSGEYGGGADIVIRAMRSVALEWLKRGPQTALTQRFIDHFGACDLAGLMEGVYLHHYELAPELALLVFEVARWGDPEALEVMQWAGDALGQMANGVINQLNMQAETFEVVLIGSLHDGSPVLNQALRDAVYRVAPRAQFVRLSVPPAVGGVLLGMEEAGLNGYKIRQRLIESTGEKIKNGG